jgi:hypothetical protein
MVNSTKKGTLTMSNSGICSHSGASAFDEFVIFSTIPAKQQRLRQYLRATHDPHGYGHKELIGCYKGEIEPAWMVNKARLDALMAEGFLDEQESILVLGHCRNGGARPAHLEFLRGDEPVKLGFFGQDSEKGARAKDAWTYDPQLQLYFTCG